MGKNCTEKAFASGRLKKNVILIITTGSFAWEQEERAGRKWASPRAKACGPPKEEEMLGGKMKRKTETRNRNEQRALPRWKGA